MTAFGRADVQPVIQVRDLTMAYGDVDVLGGVDLDIHRGEVFALLGPNGAGKTTTVEILEGFRQRSSGKVSVLGTDPERGGDAWRARIGLVLQSWRDHRRWRVAELLTHFATYYPDPRDPAELLALVGLTDQAGRQVHRLSGGQRPIADLEVRRPTLEDTYLHMVHREADGTDEVNGTHRDADQEAPAA